MQQGDFVWYELCTPDPAAAAEFYGKVVGWKIQKSNFAEMDYTMVCVGEQPVGGIMTLPPEQMPPRPVWLGYVGAGDVDAKAAEIAAAGGTIHKAPQDIPEVGRFAVMADPQGAVFLLFKGMGEPPPPFGKMQPGSIVWHELHTSDWEKGFGFYERMFGWSKDAIYDLGPAGMHQWFKTNDALAGSMLTDKAAPHPYWLYYFAVDDIDTAQQRVQANGGKLLYEPMEVPGGAWVFAAQDPQGGMFALVGMKTS